MRLPATHFRAFAIAAATFAVAGCGSVQDSSAPPSAPAGAQVQRYIDQVGQIRQSLDDAHSAYFHAPPGKAAIRLQTTAVQDAYAAAVRRLDGIEPPQVAADVHPRLRSEWRNRAEQLADVLTDKPFSTGDVDDVMAATDRDRAVDDVYTLPY